MAARKIPEPETANAGSDKAFHFVTDFVKHPANLPVNSLSQNDAQASGLERVNVLEPGALTVERDSVQQLRSKGWIPRTIDRDFVFLFDLEPRMSKPLGQIAIVSEEEKPFSLGVEPADVKKAGEMRREQIEDRIARIRVAPRRHKAGRLMQHDIEPALTVDQFAVDFYVIAIAGLRAEISADLAVYRNATGRD